MYGGGGLAAFLEPRLSRPELLMETPHVGLFKGKRQAWAAENLEFQGDLVVLTLGKGHIFFHGLLIIKTMLDPSWVAFLNLNIRDLSFSLMLRGYV